MTFAKPLLARKLVDTDLFRMGNALTQKQGGAVGFVRAYCPAVASGATLFEPRHSQALQTLAVRAERLRRGVRLRGALWNAQEQYDHERATFQCDDHAKRCAVQSRRMYLGTHWKAEQTGTTWSASAGSFVQMDAAHRLANAAARRALQR